MDPIILVILVVIIGLVIAQRQGLLSSRGSGRTAGGSRLGTFDGVRVSPRLWRKLVKLTKDEDTAHRLIRNLLLRYPERDPDWCCDKAIYDLERDRYRR
ncbi:MAG: hypothetical protein ACO4CG_11705 [Prochlorothrix sp.]